MAPLVNYFDLLRELKLPPEELQSRFGIRARKPRELFRLAPLLRAVEREEPPGYSDGAPFVVYVLSQGDTRQRTTTVQSEAQAQAGTANSLLPSDGHEAVVIECRRAILLPRGTA